MLPFNFDFSLLDANYFEDTHSYFSQNAFTTLFSNNEPTTMNTSATLPSETIYMARLKDGDKEYFEENDSLFYSDNAGYRGLHLMQASNVLHSGYYETQLQLTSNFMGYECNSTYTEFITNSSYLGIANGIIILQSTLQRMAYYGMIRFMHY